MTPPITPDRIETVLVRAMHRHWRLFLVEGLVLIVLGAGAIIVPPLAGVVATVVLGWILLLAGIVGTVATLRTSGAPGFGWSLLSGLLAIAAGALLLGSPLQGLISLTYVLIAFFVVDGVAMIFLALAHRRELSGRWEWMMLNGAMDLVLAAIIVAGWPGTAAWALGLLLGIDMLFGGASLIVMALEARQSSLQP